MSRKKIIVLTSKTDAEVPQRIAHEAFMQRIPTNIISLSSHGWVDALNRHDDATIFARVGPSSYHEYVRRTADIRKCFQGAIQHVLAAFNKADSFDIMQRLDIPIPRTRVVSTDRLCDEHTYPIVIKSPTGHMGKGVYLVHNVTQLNEVILDVADEPKVVVQEFIRESNGRHKRIFVSGSKVVASMTRDAPDEEFRSNAKGNKGRLYSPTINEVDMAVVATAAHNLPYAGVDIIDSARGPLVLEVNPSPGLTIESYANVNIARSIVTAAVS